MSNALFTSLVKQRNSNILQYVSKTLLYVQGSNHLICNPYSCVSSMVSFQWQTNTTRGKPIWPQPVSITYRGYAETTPENAETKKSGKRNQQRQKEKHKTEDEDEDKKKVDKVQTKKPLNLEHSGDLKRYLQYDPKETFFAYKDLEELKHAPETVQRLCTLAFADRTQRKFHKIHETKKKIEEVIGVKYGREMIIANMTLQIRAMLPHVEKYRKDIRSKIFLNEKIAKRKKELKRLRKEDYVSFIWLLKLLQIKYVPSKPYTMSESRFAKQKREAREAGFELKRQKLGELREKLAEERKEFFEYKQKVLADVEEKMAKYGLNKKEILKAVEKERQAKIQSEK